ncbi:spexin-like [Mastacembelus armatus]|uniref:spexin-like n=1 Tax=Mastacembelus armatus TaxID=205130 RepID=UPI000E45575B|nr:spexin-like [Mastacembelus armatus]
MSLIVTLLVMTLVTQSWTAPQRRNWTPQAILYLKGAQGHRSILERTSREVTHDQCSDGPGLSLVSSILLDLLQQTVEKGGTNSDNHPGN